MSAVALFWFAAMAVAVCAALLALWPLLSRSKLNTISVETHDASRAQRASLREAEATIAGDLAAGQIDATMAAARRSELLVRARAEDVAENAPVQNSPRSIGRFAFAACALAAVAVGVYVQQGNRAGLTAEKRSAPAAPQMSETQIRQMVERLETRLNAEPAKPEDLPQWKMLARSQKMLGEPLKVVATQRVILAIAGATAENEADLAEALLAQSEGKVSEEISKLLASAYARAPTDQKVLWLNAAAAQEQGDKPNAVKFLKALLPTVAPESQEAADIARFIAELSK